MVEVGDQGARAGLSKSGGTPVEDLGGRKGLRPMGRHTAPKEAPAMETVNKKVCTEPGCSWSAVTPGMTQRHAKSTGHTRYKTVKVTREKMPSHISYQPGYHGPETF